MSTTLVLNSTKDAPLYASLLTASFNGLTFGPKSVNVGADANGMLV